MADVKLKWKGDELFLGATKMAEVRSIKETPMLSEYVIGPEDTVSEPYQDKEDAKQDRMRHVRDMLAKAGA